MLLLASTASDAPFVALLLPRAGAGADEFTLNRLFHSGRLLNGAGVAMTAFTGLGARLDRDGTADPTRDDAIATVDAALPRGLGARDG